jgi:hypothetical protein
MVVPSESAIGRAVVYRRGEDGPPMTGIITTVGPRRVFVRLGSQPYSMAVYPAELEFIARRRSDAVRSPPRKQIPPLAVQRRG